MDPLQPAKIFFNPPNLEFIKKIAKTLRKVPKINIKSFLFGLLNFSKVRPYEKSMVL